MLSSLKSFDAFPKAQSDYRARTNTGALVSIISMIVMFYLCISEFIYYMKVDTVDHLFHRLSCNLISIDAVDDSGLSQKDAVHEIYKHRLTALGTKDGYAVAQEKLGETVRTEADLENILKEKQAVVVPTSGCGNCYGAGNDGQCCNSCQEVKDAYASKGWRFKPQGVTQCASEASMANLRDQFAEEGGCQVYGRLILNKAAGHFHIAPHRQLHLNALNNNNGNAAGQPPGGPGGGQPFGLLSLLDLISFTFDQFNVSHTINQLSFGDQFPGIQSPLDGQTRMIIDQHGMYQYFIKVVPTVYEPLKGASQSSNQYSSTEYMSHLAPGSGRGLPGIYFYYEVSPIQSHIKEQRRSLLSFLTSLCAIVGGSFSVIGLLDLLLGQLLEKTAGMML